MSEWARSLGYSAADVFPDSDSEGALEEGHTGIGEPGPSSVSKTTDDEEQVNFVETPFTIAARNAQFRRARQATSAATEAIAVVPAHHDPKGKGRAKDEPVERHSPSPDAIKESGLGTSTSRAPVPKSPVEVIVVSSDSEADEEVALPAPPVSAAHRGEVAFLSTANESPPAELTSERVLQALFQENHDFYDRLEREAASMKSSASTSMLMDSLTMDRGTTNDGSSWAPTETQYAPALGPAHLAPRHEQAQYEMSYPPSVWLPQHQYQSQYYQHSYGYTEPRLDSYPYEPYYGGHPNVAGPSTVPTTWCDMSPATDRHFDHAPRSDLAFSRPAPLHASRTPRATPRQIQVDKAKADMVLKALRGSSRRARTQPSRQLDAGASRATSSSGKEDEGWSTLRATRTLSLTASLRRPIPPTRLAPSSGGGSRLALPLYRPVGSSPEQRRRAEDLLDECKQAPKSTRLFQPTPLPSASATRPGKTRERPRRP